MEPVKSPVAGRVRNPDTWDASDIAVRAADEVRTIGVRCKSCGRGYHAAVMPWSPVLAKSICPCCAQTNEVQTREPSMASIEETFEEQYDRGQVAEHPKAFSLPSRERRTLETPLGRATLIE